MIRAISGLTICTYVISTISSQTIGTNVVSTISGLAVVAYPVSAVSSEAVCTNVVSTISSLAVVAYAVSTVSGQAVGTHVVRAIGSLAIRTSVRSVGVGRTTLRYNSTAQCVVVIGNRQSECARCQDGKTKAKNKIRSFHDVCSREVQ